jgi:pyruvate kinase
MLSGESAVGEYPVEAVKTMRGICSEAEAYLKSVRRRSDDAGPPLPGLVDPVTEASIDAAYLMTQRLDAALVLVAVETGRTAVELSNRRPHAPILALGRSEPVARRLSLCWGVTSVICPDITWAERVLEFGVEWARSQSLVAAGQRVVLLRGRVADQPHVRAVLAGTID